MILSTAMMAMAVVGATTVMAEEPAAPAEETTVERNKTDFSDILGFSAKTLDGEELTQEYFSEKDVTIIYIWATYCGYCIDEMPELEEYRETLPENVQMISICGDGRVYQDLASEILETAGLDVPTIIDGDRDMATLYTQAMYTPTTIFVDSEGYIIGEAIIGAPKDLTATYDAYLNDVYEILGIEPETEAAE